MGFADAKEAEKKLNEILKNVENFVSYNIINNGHHSSVVIYSGDENKSIIPQVKIVEFSVNDTAKAEEVINEALNGIEPISLDIATPADGNRLIILYDISE
jgi:hypothetical protein